MVGIILTPPAEGTGWGKAGQHPHLEALPGAPRVSAVSHLGAAEGSRCPLRPSGQRGGRVGGCCRKAWPEHWEAWPPMAQ